MTSYCADATKGRELRCTGGSPRRHLSRRRWVPSEVTGFTRGLTRQVDPARVARVFCDFAGVTFTVELIPLGRGPPLRFVRGVPLTALPQQLQLIAAYVNAANQIVPAPYGITAVEFRLDDTSAFRGASWQFLSPIGTPSFTSFCQKTWRRCDWSRCPKRRSQCTRSG